MNGASGHRSLYYPDWMSSHKVPILARSVGSGRFANGQSSKFVAKPYWHLIWVTDGTGVIRFDDRALELNSGSGVVVAAGQRRQFGSSGDMFEYRSASAIGEALPILASSMGYMARRVMNPGDCPVHDFRELEENIGDISETGVQRSSILFYGIFLKMFTRNAGRTDQPSICRRMAAFIDASICDPDLSVAALAERFNMHRSRLSRMFRTEIGIAPSEYIIKRRLQRAMSQLRGTHHTVAEIAYDSGFRNPDYFCRLFLKRTGNTPTAFRNEL